MSKIITDLTKLSTASEPIKLLDKNGLAREESDEIIKKLKDWLNKTKTEVAITAPQLGVNKRVFCIKFQDTIKTFINPIITKKSNYVIQPESCASMPGKEILISRPEEITVVYYTDEYKYEENKILGVAARVFDQSCQLLDGITPDQLGLVSDIEEDGTLWDLTDDEMAQVKEIYKKFIETKQQKLAEAVKANPDLEKQYKELQFTEKVINGEAAFVGGPSQSTQQARALWKKRSADADKQYNRQNRVRFINRKRK